MSRNSKIKQDLLASLPPEVTIDIFSRLLIRSIIRCKCVCKSWLELLETREFVNSYLSKPPTGLAICQSYFFHGPSPSKPYRFLEFVENSMHVVLDMSFPHDYPLTRSFFSSVNGLLFLFNLNLDLRARNYFICNPITRDYIKLPRPREYPSKCIGQVDTFGFGVSKKSGQYKVVRLFSINETKCEVYTLGTGLWRSIEPNIPRRYSVCSPCTGAIFLNGNLHWRGRALQDGSVWIYCFDLETERFAIFSAPPIQGRHHSAISALEECLVYCDNSYDERMEIDIWFMNEYGDDKSWTKKFIITNWSPVAVFGELRPIKVFKNGDILIANDWHSKTFRYSSNTETIEEADLAELCGIGYDYIIGTVSYTPSFVPLNTFTMENVSSLI